MTAADAQLTTQYPNQKKLLIAQISSFIKLTSLSLVKNKFTLLHCG